MLDKSILYAEIWMKRAHKSTPIQPIQSDNYSLRSYQAGDKGTGHGLKHPSESLTMRQRHWRILKRNLCPSKHS